MNHNAILKLYPMVVTIRGDVAYDDEGNVVEYDPVAVQQEADRLACSDKAKSILIATDWASIPDVGNSAVSNPYLVNQAEFSTYRSQIRALAINPVVNAVFPEKPTEQWSN